MLRQQISIELRKTVKQPALWLGLAGLFLLLAFFIVIHHSQIRYGFTPDDGGVERDLQSGLAFFNWVGGFVYAVTAGVITAYDYNDLRLWLTRGVPRGSLLLARWIVILVMNAGILVFSVLVIWGAASISRILFFGGIDSSQLNAAAIPAILLHLFWGSLPYLALTVFAAILSRSAVVAAGAMIVYAVVLEKVLLAVSDRYPVLTGALPGKLALILQSSNALLDRAAPRPALDPLWMTPPQATLVIGALVAVLCAISFLIFSRQDFGG